MYVCVCVCMCVCVCIYRFFFRGVEGGISPPPPPLKMVLPPLSFGQFSLENVNYLGN